MFKICLINMPFAVLHLPSIALTQIRSIMQREFGDRVSVDTMYLNHDFADFLGVANYYVVTGSQESQNTGFGDWFFREAAFPELLPNTEEYFRRYFPQREMREELKNSPLVAKRPEVGPFLDELIDRYRLDQADLVGFTSMFSQNLACFALARKIKERNPEVVTVIGGANCEWPMGQEIAWHVKQIDYVFSGGALKSFPAFVKHYLNNELEQCRNIKGVFCKDSPALSPPFPVIGEELPIDADLELDYSSYLEVMEKSFPEGDIKPTLLFETSRGCWWGERAHCTFCGLNGSTMNYRAMRADKAINLIESLFKYSAKAPRLAAVDNILPKSYPKEVFPALTPPPDVSMFYEVKADLSEEDMQALARARVTRVQPGIEALATSTLKLMRKGTNAFQNLTLLKHCLTYQIFPSWNLLVGFPGEEEEVFQKYLGDIPLLTHLPPPADAVPVRFDRYSPYFVKAEHYGLDLTPLDYYSLTYPFKEETLANLAYYFDDRNISPPYRVKMSKYIDRLREKVAYWRSRWEGERTAPHPRLYFKPDSTVIYDSRGPEEIEHQVGQIGKQLLEYLAEPKRLHELPKAVSEIPGFNMERKIGLLQRQGLIFQEGDRLMSLVMPKETPGMKIAD